MHGLKKKKYWMPALSSGKWWKMMQGLRLFSLIPQTIGGFLSAGWWEARLKSNRKVPCLIRIWSENCWIGVKIICKTTSSSPSPTSHFYDFKMVSILLQVCQIWMRTLFLFLSPTFSFQGANRSGLNASLGIREISQRITIISSRLGLVRQLRWDL